ncbi:uncharacterized protein [Aquarana catesbeiana]|uniref:uncharacterized protein n=1 Tax=Aquarana catesbeiana TaxID=8400 RepID=UPI003CCA16F8
MRELSSQAKYDEVKARKRMNKLFMRDYARSLGGTTVTSRTSSTSRSTSNILESSSTLIAKRKKLVEQLAVKKAEIEMESAIEAQRIQIAEMERLKEVKIIEARLRVYEEDMNSNHKSKSVLSEDADSYFLSYAQENGSKLPVCNEEKSHCPSILAQKNEKRDSPNSELSEKIKQDNSVPRCHCNDQENVATIVPARRQRTVPARLPVPEPTVFSGDILKFIEWKASFEMIIEHYCSRPVDKLFYLQKYVGGEAKKVLDGNFYRTDEEAYKQAWEKLNARYSHPFLVQRAFREKLNNWPKKNISNSKSMVTSCKHAAMPSHMYED